MSKRNMNKTISKKKKENEGRLKTKTNSTKGEKIIKC
jgi:hypothetical protein